MTMNIKGNRARLARALFNVDKNRYIELTHTYMYMYIYTTCLHVHNTHVQYIVYTMYMYIHGQHVL